MADSSSITLRRPWIIIILAFLHWAVPLVIFLLGPWLFRVGVSAYMDTLMFLPWNEIFTIFLLYPLLGFLIFMMRSWSYPIIIIFYGVHILMAIIQMDTARGMGEVFRMLLVVIPALMMIGYFLHPSVRRIYYDYRVRWWDAKPRFKADVSCLINDQQKALLLNLSVGGALVALPNNFQMGDPVTLSFRYEDYDFRIDGMVAHKKDDNFGIQFEAIRRGSFWTLRKLIKKLSQTGAIDARRPALWEEFKLWYKDLISLKSTGFSPIPTEGKRSLKDDASKK